MGMEVEYDTAISRLVVVGDTSGEHSDDEVDGQDSRGKARVVNKIFRQFF